MTFWDFVFSILNLTGLWTFIAGLFGGGTTP